MLYKPIIVSNIELAFGDFVRSVSFERTEMSLTVGVEASINTVLDFVSLP